MFTVYCNKAKIHISGEEVVTSGSQKSFQVQFKFSNDWDDIVQKIAVFTNDIDSDVSISTPVNDKEILDVPWEVLAEPQSAVYVGVVGVGENGVRLPTIWAKLCTVYNGSVAGNEEGREPTPDYFDRITSILEEAKQSAQGVRDDADSGLFDGDSMTVTSVEQSDEDGGLSVIHLSDGTVLRIKNGETGNGIASITKKNSDGLLDTYEILFTNGEAFEFAVQNGRDGTDGRDGNDGLNGQDGYTPVKGVDYFDGQDGTNGRDGVDGKDGYTPVKGIDYFDGHKGEKGNDGYTPIKGVDYFDGEDGNDGTSVVVSSVSESVESGGDNVVSFSDGNVIRIKNGKDGRNGQDGTNGRDGIDGVDGHTPVKGIDYFDGTNGTDGIDGEDGDPGVYYGETEPTDESHPVWINPNGENINILGSYPVLQIEYSPSVTIPVNAECQIGVLQGDVSISLGAPFEGYGIEYIFYITQPDVAYDVVLPEIVWDRGYAPLFDANTTTEVRLHHNGNTLVGAYL